MKENSLTPLVYEGEVIQEEHRKEMLVVNDIGLFILMSYKDFSYMRCSKKEKLVGWMGETKVYLDKKLHEKCVLLTPTLQGYSQQIINLEIQGEEEEDVNRTGN